MQDDIQFRGAISDFQPLKAHIVKSELDPLVLRVNNDDIYGAYLNPLRLNS